MPSPSNPIVAATGTVAHLAIAAPLTNLVDAHKVHEARATHVQRPRNRQPAASRCWSAERTRPWPPCLTGPACALVPVCSRSGAVRWRVAGRTLDPVTPSAAPCHRRRVVWTVVVAFGFTLLLLGGVVSIVDLVDGERAVVRCGQERCTLRRLGILAGSHEVGSYLDRLARPGTYAMETGYLPWPLPFSAGTVGAAVVGLPGCVLIGRHRERRAVP